MVRKDPTEKVTNTERPGGSEGGAVWKSGGKAFQAEEAAGTKALGQRRGWSNQGTARPAGAEESGCVEEMKSEVGVWVDHDSLVSHRRDVYGCFTLRSSTRSHKTLGWWCRRTGRQQAPHSPACSGPMRQPERPPWELRPPSPTKWCVSCTISRSQI